MTYMRKNVAILLAMMLSVGLPAHAGAGSDSSEPESNNQQWSETMESLQSYTAEQRDRALSAGKKTLDVMDRRIEELETWTKKHWNSLSTETRQEKSEALANMRQQRNDAAEWYGGMKHGSADAWESVKQGFIKSYDKLQSAYDSAIESLDGEEGTTAE